MNLPGLPNPHPDITGWPERADAQPERIWLEPTDRCNTRCIHCSHGYLNFGRDMAPEIYEKIRDSLFEHIEAAILVGTGEPLMSALFDPMFDECVRRGIHIQTVSNGILLNNDAVVDRLLEHDVLLTLSIDGVRPETFSFVRPHQKWETMVATLERIQRRAKALGPRRRARLQFNTVAMKKTIADLPDLVRLAARYGFDSINVLALAGEDQFEPLRDQSLMDSPDVMARIYIETMTLADRLGIEMAMPPAFREAVLRHGRSAGGLGGRMARWLDRGRLGLSYLRHNGLRRVIERLAYGFGPRARAGVTWCSVPWKNSYFSVQGHVRPCCVTTQQLGDITREEWPAIWNGPMYRNLRRTIHSWNPTACCRFCFYPTGINGGDEKQYEKYFAPWRRLEAPIDGPEVEWGEGFYPVEYEDGRAHHTWMSQTGRLRLRCPADAEFVRFHISPRIPGDVINPGRCRIGDGAEEPFDNSCADITFPLGSHAGRAVDLVLEMENAIPVAGDERDLALPIFRVEFLLRPK